MNHYQSLTIKIAILWLAILLMVSFWLTSRVGLEPASLVVTPQVPREGEPIMATIKLNNPSSQVTKMSYQLYANGELIKEGVTTLAPATSKTYQYVYKNPLLLGEQVNFAVKVSSPQGNYEQVVSLPPYPPQVMSSFVSFASFSTSLMSSMSSMSYYQTTFVTKMNFNLGLLFTIVLVALLVFLEIAQPLLQEKPILVLRKLHVRFSTVTWILFIIFMGIFYTSLIMIISTV